MGEFNIALALVGATVLVIGMVSRLLNRSILSLPLLAFLLGVLAGPVLGWLNPANWGHEMKILEEVARVSLGISLMGIALRLPPRFVFDHGRTLTVVLGLGMPLMWLISSGLALGFLDVALMTALMLGASVCATDPVVSSSIVTGGVATDNLPSRFRHTLSAEAALNDGLAFPLVMLPILLIKSSDTALQEWFVHVLGWQVLGAVAAGALLGYLAGAALRAAEARNLIDQPSFLVTTLALTLLALGAAKLLGTDSILAVFATGIAFDQQVDGKDRSEESEIQEAVNLLLTLPVFMLVGLMIPWSGWLNLGWAGVGLAVTVLALRRLPVILLLRPAIRLWRDLPVALLAGWFGPIGVAAVFYSMLVYHKTGNETVWIGASLLVAASLVVHGMTAAPIAKYYGRRYGQH
ncbi:cation:proton antiporter [Halomonas sp. SpR1]|uniref:cation:proton antiporter domain-containing protein n=1 Tax=Halomonas sp. SpR1 TaxID=3050462 RepID=UPI0027E409FF|nr:cation:proton antiporter [Halomonas sp. SpR1]MDQ7732519.1 cation:proton antiporter [Halomonas sp. SpR1]